MTNTDRLAQALRDVPNRLRMIADDLDTADEATVQAELRKLADEYAALASLAPAAETNCVNCSARITRRNGICYECNRAQVAALTAQCEGLKLNDARYRFWRKHYRSQFAMVLPGATLRFDANRPAIEAAGPDYEQKVDVAIDAAMEATRGQD